jgi:uncharacterized protein YecE (DUF72 family)
MTTAPNDSQTFSLGLAVWAYKGWLGDLFPAKSRSADFLSLYSRRFNCVEGNTTFYSIPDAATVQRWREQTPPGFEFCPKLPKTVTHNGPLLPYLPQALAFLGLMAGLADRLGPLMVQLPPSYGPARLADLSGFLQGWRAATSADLALEVRHLDWFREPHCSQLTALLTSLNVGRVLLDTRPVYDVMPNSQPDGKPEPKDDPQQYSTNKKPKVPLQPTITADFSLVRYISHPDRACNEAYLATWAAWCAATLAQNTRIYFFVHCPLEDHSPANARAFQQQLERSGVPVPPLPWDGLASASQLSLL